MDVRNIRVASVGTSIVGNNELFCTNSGAVGLEKTTLILNAHFYRDGDTPRRGTLRPLTPREMVRVRHMRRHVALMRSKEWTFEAEYRMGRIGRRLEKRA